MIGAMLSDDGGVEYYNWAIFLEDGESAILDYEGDTPEQGTYRSEIYDPQPPFEEGELEVDLDTAHTTEPALHWEYDYDTMGIGRVSIDLNPDKIPDEPGSITGTRVSGASDVPSVNKLYVVRLDVPETILDHDTIHVLEDGTDLNDKFMEHGLYSQSTPRGHTYADVKLLETMTEDVRDEYRDTYE